MKALLIHLFNRIQSASDREPQDWPGTSVACENKWANILTVGEPYAKHGVAKHFEG